MILSLGSSIVSFSPTTEWVEDFFLLMGSSSLVGLIGQQHIGNGQGKHNLSEISQHDNDVKESSEHISQERLLEEEQSAMRLAGG